MKMGKNQRWRKENGILPLQKRYRLRIVLVPTGLRAIYSAFSNPGRSHLKAAAHAQMKNGPRPFFY